MYAYPGAYHEVGNLELVSVCTTICAKMYLTIGAEILVAPGASVKKRRRESADPVIDYRKVQRVVIPLDSIVQIDECFSRQNRVGLNL